MPIHRGGYGNISSDQQEASKQPGWREATIWMDKDRPGARE
jgi:hypothetical protein